MLLDARPRPATLASSLVILAAVGLVGWVMRSNDTSGGEPFLRIKLPGITQGPAASIELPEATASTTPPAEPEAPEPPSQDAEAELPLEHQLALAPAPIKGMTEKGPDGPLPTIAEDGRAPASTYARPVPDAVLNSTKPRIALMLGGMGLDPELTRRATALPPEITLAFAPYGNDLQQMANDARANGHELMLQLPMEPFGYPATDPGPRTLRAGAEAKANARNLAWLLSRFQGYFGVVNYLGGRLLADRTATTEVMTEISSRGLHWLDDGSVQRSQAVSLAPEMGLTLRKASINIDRPDRAAVEARLAELERLAREGGIAVGTGTGLNVTLDVVEAWAAGLESRGFILVPVSAAFRFESAVGTAAAE
jgi:polysaccharide deacetylase 2 family uncharacterized protein YibQ